MSAAVMSPVTLVKTRMEYGGPNHIAYKNTAHALATIARTEGPSGLWRGLVPTVLTNAPFSALYYMIYSRLKLSLGDWQGSSAVSSSGTGNWNQTAVNFVSGVCAATAATLLTQPTDVVRTRMQLGLPGAAKRNVLDTLGHVLKSGPNALLTGGLSK
jgi:solute carrier family 25 protein 38